MTITMGKGYWVAHVRSRTSRYDLGVINPKDIVTEQDREATYEVLAKLGICGKKTKHRYLSDLRFKTEEEAKEFFLPHMSAIGLLDKMLDFNEQFDLYF